MMLGISFSGNNSAASVRRREELAVQPLVLGTDPALKKINSNQDLQQEALRAEKLSVQAVNFLAQKFGSIPPVLQKAIQGVQNLQSGFNQLKNLLLPHAAENLSRTPSFGTVGVQETTRPNVSPLNTRPAEKMGTEGAGDHPGIGKGPTRPETILPNARTTNAQGLNVEAERAPQPNFRVVAGGPAINNPVANNIPEATVQAPKPARPEAVQSIVNPRLQTTVPREQPGAAIVTAQNNAGRTTTQPEAGGTPQNAQGLNVEAERPPQPNFRVVAGGPTNNNPVANKIPETTVQAPKPARPEAVQPIVNPRLQTTVPRGQPGEGAVTVQKNAQRVQNQPEAGRTPQNAQGLNVEAERPPQPNFRVVAGGPANNNPVANNIPETTVQAPKPAPPEAVQPIANPQVETAVTHENQGTGVLTARNNTGRIQTRPETVLPNARTTNAQGLNVEAGRPLQPNFRVVAGGPANNNPVANNIPGTTVQAPKPAWPEAVQPIANPQVETAVTRENQGTGVLTALNNTGRVQNQPGAGGTPQNAQGLNVEAERPPQPNFRVVAGGPANNNPVAVNIPETTVQAPKPARPEAIQPIVNPRLQTTVPRGQPGTGAVTVQNNAQRVQNQTEAGGTPQNAQGLNVEAERPPQPNFRVVAGGPANNNPVPVNLPETTVQAPKPARPEAIQPIANPQVETAVTHENQGTGVLTARNNTGRVQNQPGAGGTPQNAQGLNVEAERPPQPNFRVVAGGPANNNPVANKIPETTVQAPKPARPEAVQPIANPRLETTGPREQPGAGAVMAQNNAQRVQNQPEAGRAPQNQGRTVEAERPHYPNFRVVAPGGLTPNNPGFAQVVNPGEENLAPPTPKTTVPNAVNREMNHAANKPQLHSRLVPPSPYPAVPLTTNININISAPLQSSTSENAQNQLTGVRQFVITPTVGPGPNALTSESQAQLIQDRIREVGRKALSQRLQEALSALQIAPVNTFSPASQGSVTPPVLPVLTGPSPQPAPVMNPMFASQQNPPIESVARTLPNRDNRVPFGNLPAPGNATTGIENRLGTQNQQIMGNFAVSTANTQALNRLPTPMRSDLVAVGSFNLLDIVL